jgi:hypothetical protein
MKAFRLLLGFGAIAGVLLTAGCEVNPAAPTADKFFTGSGFIVAATAAMDYSSGNVGMVAVGTNETRKDLLSIHGDNIVRTYNGDIYILERFLKDNLIKIAGAEINPGNVVYDKNLGSGTNIQDIAFISTTKAYVTQLQSIYLLEINPATGAITDSVNLSGFNGTTDTSAASFPCMSPIAVYNKNVYIGCQRLIGYSPLDTSCIVVISTVDNHIVDTIWLEKRNPVAMEISGDKMFVACPGDAYMDATDGGIESINLTTGLSDGAIVDETDLNGNIGAATTVLAIISPVKGYVVISHSFTNSQVVPFNLITGTVSPELTGIDNAFGGMTFDGSHLYVGDRSLTNPGVDVFDTSAGNSKVAGPLDVGIAPNSLAYLKIGN